MSFLNFAFSPQEIKEVKGSLPDFLSEATEALNAASANSPVDSPDREAQVRQVPFHLPSFASASPSPDDDNDVAAAAGLPGYVRNHFWE